MEIFEKTAKINSIFLAIILIAGAFAAVYPSFTIGIQAQSEYQYEYGYDKSNNNNSYYSSEYPPSSEYPSTEYETDRYNTAEYPPPSYDYSKSDVESNQENDYYNYPPTKEPISADIVVPIDFDTIKEAIDAANDGDVIKVLPGTYQEQITISKSLTILGSGAKSTIIEAPDELDNGVNGGPYIIEIINGATVSIKGFTISGPETETCGTTLVEGLIGISVQKDSTLKLVSTVFEDCTFEPVRVGAPFYFPTGEQIGHATITNTFITDYRAAGIVAFTSGSTVTITKNNIIGIGDAPGLPGHIGIVLELGAKGLIKNNKISNNLCNDVVDNCGPDRFTDVQSFGILALDAGTGSVISNNHISNNDVGIGIIGIGVLGSNECCIINHNKFIDNVFLGILLVDSKNTISNTKILGGDVGVGAIAFSANTTATLDQVKIVGAETPIQALSNGNLTAAVNVLSPSFFQP